MGGVSRRGLTPVLTFGFGVMTETAEGLVMDCMCDEEAKVLLIVTGLGEVNIECDEEELIDLHFVLASMSPAHNFFPETSVQVVGADGAGS